MIKCGSPREVEKFYTILFCNTCVCHIPPKGNIDGTGVVFNFDSFEFHLFLGFSYSFCGSFTALKIAR
jgi:hypothetical protein